MYTVTNNMSSANMKLSKLLITLNLSLTIGLLTPLSTVAAPKVIERVAAVVNNNVILESDINNMADRIFSLLLYYSSLTINHFFFD